MYHVMLDLETLSLQPNAAIIQIGAAMFDMGTGLVVRGFEMCLKASAKDASQHFDQKTLAWHTEDEKRNAAYRETQRLGEESQSEVLEAFSAWYKSHPVQAIWANGSNFDIPILEFAYNAEKLEVPWGYRDVRDLRTFQAIADPFDKYVKPGPTAHTAYLDAHEQAERVMWLNMTMLRSFGLGFTAAQD